jgi:hypothetical protein
MTIQIAPIEYWKDLTINEAKLYCFSLNIDDQVGWRFPTYAEMFSLCGNAQYAVATFAYLDFWYICDTGIVDIRSGYLELGDGEKLRLHYSIVPVRDIY